MTTPHDSKQSAETNELEPLSEESKAKVDRAFRLVVIDWLQFGEEYDEDRAQNTLTYIHELETELKALRNVRDAAEKLKDWVPSGTDGHPVYELQQALSNARKDK